MNTESNTITGKVCEKHPELNGRRLKNYSCVRCHTEYCTKWRLSHIDQWRKGRAEGQKRYRARKKLLKILESRPLKPSELKALQESTDRKVKQAGMKPVPGMFELNMKALAQLNLIAPTTDE